MAKTNQKTERPKIEAGYRVGKLAVIKGTEQRRHGYTVWYCRCDCGSGIFLDTRQLQRGTVRDCGCSGIKVKPGQKDLTGQRFGKLVCIEPTDERGSGGGTIWRCQCDCGNECLAVITQLTHGYKKSCGCLSHPPLKDYVGKQFGLLTVMGYAGKKDGLHYWQCRCECGNLTVVRYGNLIYGHTKSCGCLQREIHQKNMQLIDGTSVRMIEKRMSSTIKSNTSGYNGVYPNRNGTWTAQITFKGKTYYLGSYADIRDAVKARKRGEEMYEQFLAWYYSEHTNGGTDAEEYKKE